MIKKVLSRMAVLMIVAIVLGIIVAGYYKFVGVESSAPSQKNYTYNIQTEKFMNRNVYIITPIGGATNNKVIMYLHGGAYVAEIGGDHWNMVGRLIEDTGSTIVLPDYPLAPKYTYKDVFKMMEPLYKEVEEKVGANNLILMGDSAGGGMSLSLIEKISTQNNYEIPSKTILISPWLDVRLNNPQISKVKKNDKELNKESLRLAGIAYAGDDGIDNYLVNPVDGDISKLKNVTIFTGTYDILNPDTHILEDKAKQQGIDIQLKEYEKAGHIWIVNQKWDKSLVERGYNDLIEVVKK